MTVSRIVIAAFVGLGTIAAFGQIPPPAPPAPGTDPIVLPPDKPTNGARDSSQNSGKQDNQVGGGAANSNGDANNGASGNANGTKQLEGPDIVDDPNATPEQQASAEYSGPAVLSRGISASLPMNPKNIKFAPNVGLEYTINSGLTGIAPQANGKLANDLSSGVSLIYGVTGEKVLKRDTFSLSFSGSLYHYFQASNYDGTTDQLAFTWRHKLSRSLSFGLRESAQEYNNNSLLLSGSQLINSGVGTTLVTSSPTTEVFDGRVFSIFSEASLTWQLTPRFSINLSGGGFLTRRASSSLYGDTGYQTGADIAYRLTRSTTVGSYYGYTHYDYTGTYGGSDINTVGLSYSIAFNPHTQLITRVGGSRVETTGLTTVALNPILALLFGTPQTIEAIYVKNYVPDLSLQLNHKVSDLMLSVAYNRGVTPGNGVFLTSVQQNVAFSANFGQQVGRRTRWTISPTAGYQTLAAEGINNQKYESVFVGATVSRKLHGSLDWHNRVDYHHYLFDNTLFLRNSFVFGTGFSWAPGNALERLW